MAAAPLPQLHFAFKSLLKLKFPTTVSVLAFPFLLTFPEVFFLVVVGWGFLGVAVVVLVQGSCYPLWVPHAPAPHPVLCL